MNAAKLPAPSVPPAFSAAPHLARDLDDQRELRLLLVDRQRVTVDRGGEAALRAKTELLERDEPGRLVDPTLQRVLAFEAGPLARNQPEHDPLAAARHKAQRREPARARIVVFEKEPVHRQFAEQRFGDMVVAALRHPRGTEIAAAQMGAHGHASRFIGERLIYQADVDQVLVLTVAAD